MRFHSLVNILAVASLLPGVASFQIGVQQNGPSRVFFSSRLNAETASFDTLVTSLDQALEACKSEITKTCKVTVGPSSSTGRLGLVATSNIKKGEVVLAMPYDERIELSASTARKLVFDGILAKDYDGWTGDTGLITLLILNECARVSNQGVALPKRSEGMQTFMSSWVSALPSPQEMTSLHPLMWSEEDQEVLQSSTTNKVYQALDDLEEDANWLVENVFDKDRTKFPETVTWNGAELPCFSLAGFKWAMGLAQSRSVFVDGSLRLMPIVDMCNHDDEGNEVVGASMGNFGTTLGAQLKASKNYAAGEEVFCSYGPKSAADYLLEHGFCPPQCFKQAVSEVTLELDPEDRFYDDKLDILEFETYEAFPMDPKQSFDLVFAPGRDGGPDPAMIQFVRLCKLGGQDAFLLESIFRKETWGFMALPVSEKNELQVVDTICEVIEKALEEMNQCKEGGPEICTKVRESEAKALTRTLEYLQREKEALDLKEYYQQRRLKDLGLDSAWSEDDTGEGDPDLGFGQTRAPGGADYDW